MAAASSASRSSNSSGSTFRLVGATVSHSAKFAAPEPAQILSSGKLGRTARASAIQQLNELFDECSDAETASTASIPDDCGSLSSFDISGRCSLVETQMRAGNQKARYREPKLERWFKDVIDRTGHGTVYMRDFLAALREHEELQTILCEVAGVRFTAHERQEHARLAVTGVLGLSVQERTEILLAERQRIREVFRACARFDGLVDLTSFIGLFRTRGAVLE